MKRILRSVTLTSGLILVAILATSLSAFAQKTVTGVVKSDNDVLPGVTVLEKGTSNGTVTDSEGKFTISVADNSILVFSFVGMQQQEIQVGNQTTIDVNLVSDVTQLGEVVVIGYGTSKKSDITGSISSIGGDDLRKMPVATVAESLTGRLPGVQVTTAEGSPDSDVRIRVRGGGSITQDNSPLYIVDGFPVSNIADISPSDIKSIDVLKDASSTAIYGSRGANGVVIITTKGGTAGKVSVTLNSFYGAKKIAKTMDVLTPEDYVNWQYEYAALRFGSNLSSYENFFGAYQDMDLYQGMEGNDWQNQVYGRTGSVLSNDLSIRGGSDKITYSFNYARYDEKAIMVGSDYTRNNITMKLNSKPVDRIDIGLSLRYADTKIAGGGANEQNEVSSADSRLKYSIGYPPFPVSGLTTDDTDEAIANYLVNPLVGVADNDRDQLRKNFNFGGSFGWDIIDNLHFGTEVGLDNYYYTDNRFYGISTYYVDNIPAAENQGKPAAVLRERREVRYRNTNTLSYDFAQLLSNDHHAKFMIGQEMLKYEVNTTTSTLHGYPTLFTADQAFKLTTQGQAQSIDNFYSPDDKLLSFFGRLTYDYKGRYLLTATYRADGSSKFSDGNKWGYFPSAAAAWKISEESFMTGTQGWLSSLKLRLSYGTAGNNNIPTGQIVQSFVSSTTTWMNGFDSFWAASKTMANPDLRWEVTHTRNAGLDFGFMNDRLTGTIDVYKNNTTGLLIEFPVSGTGYDYQFRNMGETENKGLEVSFNYKVIDKPKYGLNVSFNIGYNRNDVVSLEVLDKIEDQSTTSNWASTAIGPDYRVLVGQPLGVMIGYQSDGRYEASDFEGYNSTTNTWTLKPEVANSSQIVGTVMPGMMKLKDITGDGLVTIDDRTMIGNALPNHTGGFVLNGYAYG
ncbi:MAG TPA: SusC/RagA family TonB-linked outer membrane protein, partial [Cyclobacteriaceae bacterium]|nr:SusC/RagA family TonB-linked outer membrane protein [Cyclobacteriaceae bacterium]